MEAFCNKEKPCFSTCSIFLTFYFSSFGAFTVVLMRSLLFFGNNSHYVALILVKFALFRAKGVYVPFPPPSSEVIGVFSLEGAISEARARRPRNDLQRGTAKHNKPGLCGVGPRGHRHHLMLEDTLSEVKKHMNS